MAGHIRQRLLADPKDRRRMLRIDPEIFMTDRTAAGDTGTPLEVATLPFDRGDQSQIVQHPGTQFRHDALHGGDRAVDLFFHSSNFFIDSAFRRKDGTSFPVEYVSTPIRERGEIVGAVVVFKDTTERKRVEAQLQDSLRRLRTLSGRMEGIREEERGRIARELHDELGVGADLPQNRFVSPGRVDRRAVIAAPILN